MRRRRAAIEGPRDPWQRPLHDDREQSTAGVRRHSRLDRAESSGELVTTLFHDFCALVGNTRGFVYDQPASRVIFGVGAFDRLAEEVERLGARRALVLATPEQRKDAEEAAHRLGRMAAGVFAEAVMHVPIETA